MKAANIKNSSITLMGVILVSKIVGMLRDVVIANYFGTSNVSDAFLIALSVPTLLFYLIGHALSTAYIPMYNRVKVEKGEKAAQRFSDNLLTIAMILSTLIVLVLLFFPGVVVKIFAAGFDQKTADIAIRLIRISTPSIFIMCAVYVFGGYLQANKNFLVPAAISLPRNVVIVIAVALAASLGLDWLGYGLLASYVVELLVLLPFVIKKGYLYKPCVNLKDDYMRQTMYMVVPIVLGVCVGQVNKIVDKSMASIIVEGGISALTYASIINNAVQEVLVTGIVTILFAKCSEYVAKQEHDKVKQKLSGTINAMILLLTPACVGVWILAEPIVSLVLCHGEFDQHSLQMTAGALRFYILGLLFLAIRDTMVKVFYAYKETKTTTIVSITAIAGNIIMNIVLGMLMGINGLALATSLSAAYSCVLLYVLLRKKIGDYGLKNMLLIAMKSLLGCVPMALVVWFLNRQSWLQAMGIGGLLICVLLACVVYFAVELLFRNELVFNVVKSLKKRVKKEK